MDLLSLLDFLESLVAIVGIIDSVGLGVGTSVGSEETVGPDLELFLLSLDDLLEEDDLVFLDIFVLFVVLFPDDLPIARLLTKRKRVRNRKSLFILYSIC